MIKITSDKKTGHAARLTRFENGWSIETWYDRHYLTFTMQIKDAEGNTRDPKALMELGWNGLGKDGA